MQTVLVVEDSKLLRVEREHTLKKAGYLVLTAVDGVEALSVAHESHPDLILLDMMLPKLSGQEVLQRLRAHPSSVSTPVIVLTSLPESNREKLLGEGASLYFEKSLLRLENGSGPLLDAIETLLARRVRVKAAASPAI